MFVLAVPLMGRGSGHSVEFLIKLLSSHRFVVESVMPYSCSNYRKILRHSVPRAFKSLRVCVIIIVIFSLNFVLFEQKLAISIKYLVFLVDSKCLHRLLTGSGELESKLEGFWNGKGF